METPLDLLPSTRLQTHPVLTQVPMRHLHNLLLFLPLVQNKLKTPNKDSNKR